MLSQYITKWKYTIKMIQIIAKPDDVFSHILIMNWLYHFNYNWKVWLTWFHKKHYKFFIQTNINVLKQNILFINHFDLKDDKNYVGGGLCIKIHFIYLSKCRWNQRKTTPKIYSKNITTFCLKQPPL